MELVVACVLAYWLVRHGPELVAEAFAEVEFAKRGEMSPQVEARAKRLADAGIDPASGGAARQFLGNVWRDAWLDLDEARSRRRAGRADRALGARRSFRDWFDEAVDELGDRWRHRTQDTSGPAPDDGDADQRTSDWDDDWDDDDWDPPTRDTRDDRDGPDRDRPPPDEPDEPATPRPDPEPQSAASSPDDEEPVRVPSTQGEPYRLTPAPEGDPVMTGTAVVHVTGVSSAAHEARNIANQISAVTEAYKAALELILRRAHNLGESTVSEIQQAMTSQTVKELQAACEALAAAKAAATTAVAEAGPAMYRVARAFERIV